MNSTNLLPITGHELSSAGQHELSKGEMLILDTTTQDQHEYGASGLGDGDHFHIVNAQSVGQVANCGVEVKNLAGLNLTDEMMIPPGVLVTIKIIGGEFIAV